MTINHLDHREAKDHQALANACVVFADALKQFIKTPKAGDTAHIAAQCLFEVRRLDNALTKTPLALVSHLSARSRSACASGADRQGQPAGAQQRQENTKKASQPQEHL